MAAAVKFILNKTWPNSAFGSEAAMRKLAHDNHNELEYIGDVEQIRWRSCPQFLFYVLVMKGRRERVLKTRRNA